MKNETRNTSLHFTSNVVELDKRKHKRVYSDADMLALCDPDNAHVVSNTSPKRKAAKS